MNRRLFPTLLLALSLPALAQTAPGFHHAPATAAALTNPVATPSPAVGRSLFAKNCAACHGDQGQGTGNIPSLAKGAAQSAAPGEIFWYLTHGDLANGMPAWNTLSPRARWQLVSFVKSLPTAQPAAAPSPAANTAAIDTPPPTPPFTDFRYEHPGTSRKITPADLPAPFATVSVGNGPHLVPRPQGAWPVAPAGFKVEMYTTGLDNPRLIRRAPNGDLFLAESDPGRIRVLRGLTPDGKPQLISIYATGLKRPFGIAFYPAGPNPEWLYIGDTDAVLRFPYHNGDLAASAKPERIADLPANLNHWTRDIQFSLDGKTMFVGIGSGSNVDDPDTHPAEHERADILAFTPEGADRRIYASGIRNPVGLAVNPITGELWCSVNERDALGDNLVPDYITHVEPGGFYGWPWWYIGGHQDPRHPGTHPELQAKLINPDVLLQPHNASLEMTFYDGSQFPAEYQGDIFASEHGSWNRATRTGYEVIRVPLHQTGHSTGDYQDFLTGFVLPNGEVWGRPVGITTGSDGSLYVTDDASGTVWHVTYTGK